MNMVITILQRNTVLELLIFPLDLGEKYSVGMINEVQNESPAQIAGLKKNDLILEIDGNKVQSILDVSKLIMMSTSEFIDFKIQRFENELILKVKPNIIEAEDNIGNKVKKRIVGITLSPFNNEINHVKLGPAKALYHSINEVYFVCISSLKYLGSIKLGGPIRIAKITGQVAEIGFIPFLSIMAYISISLGLINLFPIPLLDGGHLMFYGFEKVLGRPLSQKTQEGFFRIGMFLLLFLMFFATFNDLKDLGLF